MIHARSDYDRFQDPALLDSTLLSEGSTPIAEDEPVFLIRAKDAAFCETVLAWIQASIRKGADEIVLINVSKHIGKAIAWQAKNGTKISTVPKEVLK